MKSIQSLDNVSPVGSNNPYGVPNDESSPGLKDGTPIDKKMVQDMLVFFNMLVDQAGITPNNLFDNVNNGFQLFEAFLALRTPDDSITNDKIADGAVREDSILDDSVTTNKIASESVTYTEMQNVPGNTVPGRNSSGTGSLQSLTMDELVELIRTEAYNAMRDMVQDMMMGRTNSYNISNVYGIYYVDTSTSLTDRPGNAENGILIVLGDMDDNSLRKTQVVLKGDGIWLRSVASGSFAGVSWTQLV